MNLARYHVLALDVFGDAIDTFDHVRETVELRDSSRWRANMSYTCFYCVRQADGTPPPSLITRFAK